MLRQGLSRGAENTSDPWFRKKVISEKSKSLKQRSKALSDVKNTIHSHASNLVKKNKNGDKKNRNGGIATNKVTNKLFNELDGENDVKCGVDVSEPEFECINHYACENANNMALLEFFDEYRLTENELNRFSNKMNFFRLDPLPFKINALSPVEDVDLNLTNKTSAFHEEDLIDDIMVEVPEPLYF